MTTTGMLRRTLGSLTLFAIMLTLALPAPASAQLKLGDWTLEGGAEAGGRFFINEPPQSSRAKWEEYNDYTGPFLSDLDLRLWSKDDKYWAEFGGTKWGAQDQEFRLGGGRLGLFEFGFEWDQIWHLISTDARLLATQSTSGNVGVFTLPSTRPSLVFYNSAPTEDLSVRWDQAKMLFRLTPTPDLDITAQYTRTFKHGNKPMGMAFGSPGNNFYEVLQPIDQTVNDLRLTATWAKESWQLQFNYTLSIFSNDLTAIRADNPCFGLPAATAGPLPGCGADATGAPAAGQSALYPSNMANTFTLSGGVSLPMRTRVTGNFSYSRQTQNQDFLPMTINPTLASAVSPFQQNSLDGLVQTWLINLGAVSRPMQPLTLTLKYRYFNLQDSSSTITFQNTVLDDRTLAGAFRAGRWPYSTQSAQGDARWQFGPPAAVTLGGGWDWMARSDHREVPVSNEAYAKLAVDATPFDWLLARVTYRPSFRRISEYDTGAHAEHSVIEDPVAATQGQSVLLRKYDEAERNRQTVQLYLQFMPLETLTITPTVNYNYDNYLSSQTPLLSVDPAGQGQRSPFLGVQNGSGWQVGADVNWAPVQRFSMAVGYMYENYFRKMESRSRPVVTAAGGIDFSDFDWISDINDIYQTFYATMKIGIIPQVLDAAFNTSYAGALGTVKTRNPVAPTSGTAAQDASAKAQRFPAYVDNLYHLDASLSYHFWKNWTATLGYVYEIWRKQNWQTDTLNPYIPGVSSIWLGNDLRNYTANTIYGTLAYTFR